MVEDLELDRAASAPGSHSDGAPARGVLDGVVDERAEDLAQLLAVGFGREGPLRDVDDEVVRLGHPVLLRVRHDLVHDRPDLGRGQVDLQVARVEPRHVQERVDDRGQPVGLGGDVPEERPALVLAEEHVLPEQRLGEAVDGGQRRPQLVRDRGDEVRLHLLDAPVGGDVAEREDPAGDGSGRIAHHGLREREPHVLPAPHDRDEPVPGRRVALGLEPPLQDLLERISSPGRPSASAAGTPVIFCAASFQRTTSPSRSIATMPSAMFARIAKLRSFSSATRW